MNLNVVAVQDGDGCANGVHVKAFDGVKVNEAVRLFKDHPQVKRRLGKEDSPAFTKPILEKIFGKGLLKEVIIWCGSPNGKEVRKAMAAGVPKGRWPVSFGSKMWLAFKASVCKGMRKEDKLRSILQNFHRQKMGVGHAGKTRKRTVAQAKTVPVLEETVQRQAAHIAHLQQQLSELQRKWLAATVPPVLPAVQFVTITKPEPMPPAPVDAVLRPLSAPMEVVPQDVTMPKEMGHYLL